MNTPQSCTVAVSSSGQFLGWVEDGDDISAAVSCYKGQVGEVTIFKTVQWADVPPPGAKILFKGIDAGKPFVIYR